MVFTQNIPRYGNAPHRRPAGQLPGHLHRQPLRVLDGQGFHGDPDRSPWPVLALGIALILVCLILIARFALAVLG